MPALSALTALGQKWRAGLPSILRDSPDHLGVLHSVARECERLEQKIQAVLDEAFPQTATLLLGVWERQLGLPVASPALSTEQRRSRIVDALRRIYLDPSGASWKAAATRLIGPGWDYEEHIPGDDSSPEAGVIAVRLNDIAEPAVYDQLERVLSSFGPAHIDFRVSYGGGFLLDVSQMDRDGLA